MPMTGPARFAWIIATICCAWTFADALARPHAAWAAPRDAIRPMPTLTHTSEFRIKQSEGEGAPVYEDNYTYTWDALWLPPPVPLGNAASLMVQTHYTLTMTDFLNRISGISADGRRDNYEVLVRLDNPGGLWAQYRLAESDTQSNQSPSLQPRTLRSGTTRNVNLRWNKAGLPVISYEHRQSSTYGFLGTDQTDSSEELFTGWQAEFRSDAGQVGQRYFARFEDTRQQNFGQGFLPSSKQKMHLEGDRRVNLGALGGLQLGYEYNEVSDGLPALGNIAAPGSSTTWETITGLALGGNVSGMPLRYDFGDRTRYVSYSAQPGGRQNDRRLQLTFTPPVPQGRSAALVCVQEYAENVDASSNTAKLDQQLSWNYTLNPRTSGSFAFQTISETDRLVQLANRDQQVVNAELHYNVPGNRGQWSAYYSQNLQRQPQLQQSNVNDTVTVNSLFPLGRSASMAMFYSQSYSTSFSSPLSLPHGTDYTLAGFRYSLQGDQGLGLDATWQQQLRGYPGANKVNTQILDLTLSYQTAATWRYSLTLHAQDGTTTPTLSPHGFDYATENTIVALVTYSF